LLFNGLSWCVLVVEVILFCDLIIEAYSVNECPVKFIIMSPSTHPHLVCTHALLIVHAIGASEVAASFELERVNHEGPVITQEAEAQPAGQEEPEEEVESPSHEPALFVKGKPRSILSLPL